MTVVPPLRVVVAVPTYCRPDEIAGLVPLLLDQVRAAERTSGVCGRVVVVDNDPAGGARAALASLLDRLTYVLEPQPGISAARNRALDEAAEDDLLVFVDDDERPSIGWLEHLLTTWRATGAAAVAGPVRSLLDDDVDPWIRAGGFFERRHRNGLPTGSPIAVAATNNLLLDLRTVRALALRFDPDFGLTGGEDSLFTRSLTDAGAVVVWCAEAEVTEVVPGHRLSRRWVLLRQVSSGNSSVLVDLHVSRSAYARVVLRARYLVGGLVRVLAGLARAGGGLVARRPSDQARGARTAARGLGMLGGAVGWSYEEYRRPQSPTPQSLTPQSSNPDGRAPIRPTPGAQR